MVAFSSEVDIIRPLGWHDALQHLKHAWHLAGGEIKLAKPGQHEACPKIEESMPVTLDADALHFASFFSASATIAPTSLCAVTKGGQGMIG